MFPVTGQPPQSPVENLIERLKEDAIGIDGFRGAPEEFEYLIHSLEEKKMTDFMIKKLENKVLGLQEELDRERHLHEKT
ncbi:hypothetical protein GCK72_016011 [Caenorhabditis remanei]|uniref:Uncharacterized protein n=1 Tax=Caenorhabditis remanei TaxID=31234 RepID=A0A6A5GY78_CAERE|nr:hypothetical protein GCK72_016011 [Caenorhabditis remanei]KAF1759544.1 hypothetical protein GCK72_016011 [Caenorhabditis remanei]